MASLEQEGDKKELKVNQRKTEADQKGPKVNKGFTGQSNHCECGKEPTKERQYKYKYKYQFKYQLKYEHKRGKQDGDAKPMESPEQSPEKKGGKKELKVN